MEKYTMEVSKSTGKNWLKICAQTQRKGYFMLFTGGVLIGLGMRFLGRGFRWAQHASTWADIINNVCTWTEDE